VRTGAQNDNSLLTYDSGEMPINAYTDINAVCDVFKTWMRQLPEAVFPASFYMSAMEAGCAYIIV
jgi:hypothetical protein